MKKISIVIPVYNEDFFISGTLESISQIDYPSDNFEVIVVTDGCTDGTVAAVKKFPFVFLIELDSNVGRYAARKMGAEAARFSNILFIDSRTRVYPFILSIIDQTNAKAIQGANFSVENPGPFEIFYKAIRRKVYSKYYAQSTQVIELNKYNFDAYPKGTNVFFVQKDILFQAYDDLSTIDMSGASSDDTKLINAIVQRTPVIIHPDVKILYFYRKSFLANAVHLFKYRGVTFVDYYFHPSQKYFWLVIIFPFLVLLGILAGLVFIQVPLLIKVSILIGLDLIISIYLANSFRDFYIILFMMPLCASFFYAGIIRGIFIKYKKGISGKYI